MNAARLIGHYGGASLHFVLAEEIDQGRLLGVWNAEREGGPRGTPALAAGGYRVERCIAQVLVISMTCSYLILQNWATRVIITVRPYFQVVQGVYWLSSLAGCKTFCASMQSGSSQVGVQTTR